MFATKEFQHKAEESNEALSANIKQAEARVVFALINFIMTWRAKFPTQWTKVCITFVSIDDFISNTFYKTMKGLQSRPGKKQREKLRKLVFLRKNKKDIMEY